MLELISSHTILHESQINGKLGQRTLIESRASCLSDQMEGDMRLGWVDPCMAGKIQEIHQSRHYYLLLSIQTCSKFLAILLIVEDNTSELAVWN